MRWMYIKWQKHYQIWFNTVFIIGTMVENEA